MDKQIKINLRNFSEKNELNHFGIFKNILETKELKHFGLFENISQANKLNHDPSPPWLNHLRNISETKKIKTFRPS